MESNLEKEKLEINKNLLEKEGKSDSLKTEMESIKKELENLQVYLQKGYVELSNMTQEISSYQIESGLKAQLEYEEQQKYFMSQIASIEEAVDEDYGKKIRTIEREIEDLYQKRRENEWG